MSSSGAWISTLHGTPLAVGPLSDRLENKQGADRQATEEVRALFERISPDVHQNQLEAEIATARRETVQSVQKLNASELAALSDRFSASIGKLEAAVLGIEKVVASEVVDLALLVAGEIVKTEMQHNPELLVGLVEDALADLPHDGSVLLRLHPADLDHVQGVLSSNPSLIEFATDSNLSRGDCILETPTKIIDASIETRLSAVRDSLVRLLMAEEESSELRE